MRTEDILTSLNAETTTLDLEDGSLSDEGMTRLVNLIENSYKLKLLNVAENVFSPTGAMTLAACLKKKITIQELNVSRNGVYDDAGVAFIEAMSKQENITVINFELTFIGDQTAKALANLLRTKLSLEKLNLSNNLITDEGANELLTACLEHPNLREIKFLNNNVTEQWRIEAERAIKAGNKKMIFELDDTLLVSQKEEGDREPLFIRKVKVENGTRITIFDNVKSVINIISDNDGSTVSCCNNKITDKQAREVAKQIRKNTFMREFIFANNCFATAEGAGCIVQALVSNSRLQKIDITGTNFNDAQRALIRIICDMNQPKDTNVAFSH